MAIDTLLVLAEGQTIVADGNSDYIEVEGGIAAWVHMMYGAMAGGTSMDTRVMVSIDDGANYFMKGKFQQVVPTDDNKDDRILVYIPQPATAGHKVRVRLNYDVTGAISVAIFQCVIEAQVGISAPAVDEQAQTGAASLISAL
jgi:hypothetical protein